MFHKLTQVGASVGVTIPKKLLELFQWKQGEEVFIEPDLERGTITIKHVSQVKEKVHPELKKSAQKMITKYEPALKKLADR